MQFIGIDVAEGSSVCVSVKGGHQVGSISFKHNRGGFNQLKHFISQTADKPVLVFESTGTYSDSLARFCRAENYIFYELNAFEAKIKMRQSRPNKTDAHDAFHLALLAETQYTSLHTRRVLGEPFFSLRQLSRQYHQFFESRRRTINNLHAVLETTFRELNDVLDSFTRPVNLAIIRLYPHPDLLFGLSKSQIISQVSNQVSRQTRPSGIRKRCVDVLRAAELSYPAVSSSSVMIEIIRRYCDQIESLNSEIKLLVKELIKTAGQSNQFSILCSIPGVGQLSAALLMGELGDINQFKTYKQLNAYAGIDTRHYQSGKTEKADIITRHGRPRARLVMYQIIVGMLLNQQRTPSHITDYYYKMKRQPFNKKHMVAVTACMNQLTRTICNLVHTNQKYDYRKASH